MYKSDFPIFQNKKLVFLDSAASAQKPAEVINTLSSFYTNHYANVHRGSCEIATTATQMYEEARKKIADFISAPKEQLIFTKGTTESINLVATGYAQLLTPDDEVLVCIAEHHANFVPWQQACLKSGAKFVVFNILPSGEIDWDDFELKLSPKTKLVALAHMSNVLGILNPIEKAIEKAHNFGARVLIDGAQSIAHTPVNVNKLDCDYFVFSGHKLYGPTGIGCLYGKKKALDELPPYQFGGDMIRDVSVENTTFADIPNKFEAGTPPFAQAVGLAQAVSYLKKITMQNILQHEIALTDYLIKKLLQLKNVQLLGTHPKRQGIVSFVIKGIHPADIAFALAEQHICVRVGHHCAMPVHRCFHQDVSIRVSLGLYNDETDIDCFIQALNKTISLFGDF